MPDFSNIAKKLIAFGISAAGVSLPVRVVDNGDGTGSLALGGTVVGTFNFGRAYALAAAGTSGSYTVPGGTRVWAYGASATNAGASITVGAITVPLNANESFNEQPSGQLVGPITLAFAGTDSYYVSVVV